MDEAFYAEVGAADGAPGRCTVLCKAFGAPRAEVARALRDAAELMDRRPEAFEDTLDEFTVEAAPPVFPTVVGEGPPWRLVVAKLRVKLSVAIERLAKRVAGPAAATE